MYQKMYHHSRIPTILGGSGGGSLLPPELQACEYLETDGNSYINLGFKVNTTNLEHLEFKYSSFRDNFSIYGASNDTNKYCHYHSQYDNAADAYIGNNSPLRVRNLNVYDIIFVAEFKTIQLLKFDRTLLTQGSNSSNTDVQYNAFLFARNKGGNIEYAKNGLKIYYFYNIGVIDLLSCYVQTGQTYTDNKSNVCPAGTPGMYDTINNVFYTNDGTGNFTPGPDIII